MNTLRSPIVGHAAAAARPAVDRSRTRGRYCVCRSTSRVSSPRNFRSCGMRPIDANGKISVPSPISVQPVDRPPTRRSGSSRRCRTCGADGGVRTDRRSLADLGRRVDDGRRMRSRCGRAISPSSSSHFGDDLIADDTRSPAHAPSDARRRPSEISSRSRSPGTTWRRNFASLTPRR